MGCKACNKILNEEEGGQINFANNILNNKQFEDQFNIFLQQSECEKTDDNELNSNITENYLNYSNDHELVFPPEFQEGNNLYEIVPIKFKNGNIFKGKWNSEHQMEGKGKYYIKTDNIFIEGFWERGELKYGRIFMPDGNIYEGNVKDSKYNGKGKLILDKAEYEGYFENGELKNGKMTWNNGYEYEGDFNGYCLQGKGKLTGPEGDIYEGDFSNNLFHGNGKYIYGQSKNEYDGEFEFGIKKGKGKYIANNEYIYEGKWNNDLPFGNGKLTKWDNSCIFKCTFRGGKIAEEPIYEVGSKEDINIDEFEIKPEEMKLKAKNLPNLNIIESESTQFILGSVPSFLKE